MLVLSRKEDQKVCFPGLGITVQILGVRGSTVRLGIDAPVEVRIVREELQHKGPDHRAPRSHVVRLPKELRHELRNQLNSLSLGLHLFKHEVSSGRFPDADATFEQLVEHIERLSANELLQPEGAAVPRTEESTALLVEDEPNEREMLAGFLRMHGYKVVVAADGLEAIDYLESHEKPRVILMDMRMPRCDGATVIRRIRRDHAYDNVRIFAISGTTPEENGLDAANEGVNRWFTKPLNPQSLVDAIAVGMETPKPTAA